MEVTPELVALAVAACEDADAAEVFGDALQLAGWFDLRAIEVLNRKIKGNGKRYRAWNRHVGRSTPDFARAVLSVFLFGDFSVERWPIPPREFQWAGVTMQSTTDILRRLYPQTHVDATLYQRHPFYALVTKL